MESTNFMDNQASLNQETAYFVDNQALRIYTTTVPTKYRFYTLMQNPLYGKSIAWKNMGYNQPPHLNYFLGYGMNLKQKKARPDIYTILSE